MDFATRIRDAAADITLWGRNVVGMPIEIDRKRLESAFRLNEIGYWGNLMAHPRVQATMPTFDPLALGGDIEYLARQAAGYKITNEMAELTGEEVLVRVKNMLGVEPSERISEEDIAHECRNWTALLLVTLDRGSRFFNSPMGLSRSGIDDAAILTGPQINLTHFQSAKDHGWGKFALTVVDGLRDIGPLSAGTPVGPVRLAIQGSKRNWVFRDNGSLAVEQIIINDQPVRPTRENINLAMMYGERLTVQIFEGRDYQPEQALDHVLRHVHGHRLHVLRSFGGNGPIRP